MRYLCSLFAILWCSGQLSFAVLEFVSPPASFDWRASGYNPDSTTTFNTSFTLTFQNTLSSSKSYVVEATFGNNPDQAGGDAYFLFPRAARLPGTDHYLFYQFYTSNSFVDNNIWYDDGSASSHLFSGTVSGSSTKSFTFYMRVAAEQIVPSGVYEDEITVRLEEGFIFSPATRVFQDSFTIPVRITVVSYLYFDLIDGNDIGRSASVDFGAMTANASRSLLFRFRTNSDVSISFDSLNDGNLEHSTLPGSIPYTMRIDFNPNYDLTSNPPTVVTYPFFAEKKTITLNFKLPSSIPDITAATYSDTIQVELETP